MTNPVPLKHVGNVNNRVVVFHYFTVIKHLHLFTHQRTACELHDIEQLHGHTSVIMINESKSLIRALKSSLHCKYYIQASTVTNIPGGA